MIMSTGRKKLLSTIGIVLCLCPFVSPGLALGAGLTLALVCAKSNDSTDDKDLSYYTSTVLQVSVVLMAFGMNLTEVAQTCSSGFSLTLTSVICTISLGLLLGRLLKVEATECLLISLGTAICGGSAIAAAAPVLKAKQKQIVLAMMVVFILNALALYAFPFVGQQLNLSQELFGRWAAIAIHDTSSVVGASAAYGEQALQTATIIKLTRALWIVPLCLCLAIAQRRKGLEAGKVGFPWFIAFFILAILCVHFFPTMSSFYTHLQFLGHRGMVVALFLVGTSIKLSELRKTAANSFCMGFLLWVIVAASSLAFLKLG